MKSIDSILYYLILKSLFLLPKSKRGDFQDNLEFKIEIDKEIKVIFLYVFLEIPKIWTIHILEFYSSLSYLVSNTDVMDTYLVINESSFFRFLDSYRKHEANLAFDSLKTSIRWSAFTISFFSIRDIIATSDSNWQVLFTRILAMIIAFPLLFLAERYMDKHEKIKYKHQQVFLFAKLWAGFTLIRMMSVTTPEEIAYYIYFAGIIFVFLFCYLIPFLLVKTAIISSIIILASYNIASIYYQDIFSIVDGWKFFWITNMFLFVTILIGLVGCWQRERNCKIDFLLNYTYQGVMNEEAHFREIPTQQLQDLMSALNCSRKNAPSYLRKLLIWISRNWWKLRLENES